MDVCQNISVVIQRPIDQDHRPSVEQLKLYWGHSRKEYGNESFWHHLKTDESFFALYHLNGVLGQLLATGITLAIG